MLGCNVRGRGNEAFGVARELATRLRGGDKSTLIDQGIDFVQTYAEAAAARNNGKPDLMTEQKLAALVKKKKREPAPTLIKKPYTRTAREIIIQLERVHLSTPPKLADSALKKVNTVLVDHRDIAYPPFLLSRVAPNNALVLTTAFQ